jgi:hypothetical protein
MAAPSTATLAKACSSSYGNEDGVAYMIADGWERVRGMRKSAVWVRGKHLVIAYRGTVLTDVEDLACDLALAWVPTSGEQFLLRYIQALMNFRSLVRLFPHHKVTLTGHSLAGNLALYVAFHNNSRIVKCVTFNAYISINMWSPSSGVYLPWFNSPTRNRSFMKCDVRYVITDIPVGVTCALFTTKNATLLPRLYDPLKCEDLADLVKTHRLDQWY